MAGVMSDHHTRPGARTVSRKVFPCIVHQPLGSPAHIVKIHRVRSDTRKLRPCATSLTSRFGPGDNLANRPSSESPCTESKSLKKTIVQLRPFSVLGQFFDRRSINRIVPLRE